jgi:hypothetical protein
MIEVTAENRLPARLTLQITGLTAQNRLFAVSNFLQLLQSIAKFARQESSFLRSFRSFVKFVRHVSSFLQLLRSFRQTLQMTGMLAENCFLA